MLRNGQIVMRNTQPRLIRQQNPNGVISVGQPQSINPSFNSPNGLPLTGSYTLIQDPLIQTLTTDPRLNASYQTLSSNPRFIAANTNNSSVNNNTYSLLPCNNGSYYVTSNEPIGSNNNSPGSTLQ